MLKAWKSSLAWRQLFLIAPAVLLVVVALVYYLTREAETLLGGQIESNALRSAGMSAAQLDGLFSESARTAEMIALLVEDEKITDEDLINYLKQAIADLHKSRPEVSGGSIAFAPEMRHRGQKYCMWYSFFENTTGGEVQNTVDVDGSGYDYFNFYWFKNYATKSGPGKWSEPYFDENLGNIAMTTYSYPFYLTRNGNPVFAGVVTVDISLEQLSRYLQGVVGCEGYAYLITREGRLVVHPEFRMTHTVFDMPRGDRTELSYFWNGVLEGGSGFQVYPFPTALAPAGHSWVSYTTVDANGWVVGAVIVQNRLFEPLIQLRHYASILAVAMVVLALVLLALVTMRALRPLRLLAPVARRIGSGDFSVQLPRLNRSDEVGQLTDAFAAMQQSLQRYVTELETTTAARNRFESEVAIANQIQQSLLPKGCPDAICRREFELFAALIPAKGVGGDLYDYFYLSDDELVITVGDVSGKGIPAALFMAVTQTLNRGAASGSLSAGEIVTRINTALERGNDMMMFVTLFFGILNVRTGVMHYANAGHNPPLVRGADGKVRRISGIQGPPLGVSGATYATAAFHLAPGEMFIAYTDGVTEAFDSDGNQFTLSRLEQVVAALPDDVAPEKAINTVLAAVTRHAGGAEQSDDITLLALRMHRF
ncbi:MAG: SpoIIE family protein phosphatase [Victivallaceae bacterium]|nr:SpoIIE family protein phosphatase [Victivallaceae bacterium]